MRLQSCWSASSWSSHRQRVAPEDARGRKKVIHSHSSVFTFESGRNWHTGRNVERFNLFIDIQHKSQKRSETGERSEIIRDANIEGEGVGEKSTEIERKRDDKRMKRTERKRKRQSICDRTCRGMRRQPGSWWWYLTAALWNAWGMERDTERLGTRRGTGEERRESERLEKRQQRWALGAEKERENRC